MKLIQMLQMALRQYKCAYIRLAVVFLAVIFAVVAAPANAEEGAGVVVTPSIIDEAAKPRDILKYTVTVRNNNEHKIEVYPTVNDMLLEDGKQEFTSPSRLDKTRSLAAWIRIKRAATEIPAGGEKEIPLEIQVGLSAEPGKYYAKISFPYGSNRNDAEKRIEEINQPELLINLNIADNIVEKAQISNFSVNKSMNVKFPIDFAIEIDNSGNVEAVPHGSILLYNRRGVEVAQILVNQAGEAVAAGEKKVFSELWESKRGFGKYKARLELEYGEKDKRDLQDTIYLWVLPIRFLAIFLGGTFFLLILLSVIIFRRSYKHTHQSPSQRAVVEPRAGVLNLKDK